MRTAVLGCGQMGRAAAYALATHPGTSDLVLLDRDPAVVAELQNWLTARSTASIRTAATVDAALADRDAVAMAMPWAATESALRAAVRAGVPATAVTRPPTDRLDQLDADVRSGGGTVVLPFGLEPGLTELLAVDLAGRLDTVDSLDISCGGIPSRPLQPLNHTSFFGGENSHHLPIGQRDAFALSQGQVVTHPRFSGVEEREVEGVGRLEAYHDGMAPWLGEHPALRGVNCTQKTLRWPGFAKVVAELARLGLLAEQPVDVDGALVSPRRLVERVLAPQVRATADDRDMVVLQLTAHGLRRGRPTSLRTTVLDRADDTTGLSAMARTTGFTLAAATDLVARRAITGSGWLKPHLALSREQTEQVMRSLTARGIHWAPAHPVPAAEH
ncbi:saccharopine dehydrogenase family protein [Streptomyces sparsus]